MLLDAWANYERYAWGENQLKPVSLRGEDGGIFGDSQIGATIIDALGTLHIMGLSDEYRKASDWIKNNLDFPSLVTICKNILAISQNKWDSSCYQG